MPAVQCRDSLDWTTAAAAATAVVEMRILLNARLRPSFPSSTYDSRQQRFPWPHSI